MKKGYLGIDVGSVSTNIVLLDEHNTQTLHESLYIRTNAQPLLALKNGLTLLSEKGYKNEQILGVGVTGSARSLIGKIVKADIIKNEITAHAIASINAQPDVQTVIEIGGQDSKIIIIRNKVAVDFAMNSVCAAGTGSFLDQQSFRMSIGIEQFGDLALKSTSPVRIAGRCTVFAESDMIHKQQLGFSREDIIYGLCQALVRNYINNVAKGKELLTPILFQGGVAHNKGILAAFEQEISKKLIIPPHFDVMGAIGCCLLAKERIERTGEQTQFSGFDTAKSETRIKLKLCDDCSNNCELTEAYSNNKLISTWGDRCGKYSN